MSYHHSQTLQIMDAPNAIPSQALKLELELTGNIEAVMMKELTSVQGSSDMKHHSDELSTVSNSSERQDTILNKKIQEELNLDAEIWKTSDSFMKSHKMRLSAFVLFTCLVITIGVLTVCLSPPKLGETCERTFKRTMKSSIVYSSRPRCIAFGDLNSDHRIDIVVANSATNTIGVFVAKTDGTFEKSQTYYTGSESRPYWVAVGNFNDDNYLDVAVANYGTNNIGIFLGNGSGMFADQRIFSLNSSRPVFITVADFNKDNRMDIVVANDGTDSIGILLGYGNGSFQNQTMYSTGYDSLPSSLAVEDFNNDSYLDIAVANYGTNNIGIFFGYGNGTFTKQKTYTTTVNSNPSSIAVADFNNDGQFDIAVTNNGSGNFGIFLGQGNGSFAAQIPYSTGPHSYPEHITVGYFDKDNAFDIAIVDSKNDRLYIFPGYGDGSFATIITYDTISGSAPYGIAATYLNNNNQSQIVIVNYGTNNILVLFNYSITFSASQMNYNVQSQGAATSVAVTDLNNDHIFDVIFSKGNNIFTLIGLGNGTFNTKPACSTDIGSIAQYICVGDLNNDTRMDIVSANLDSDRVGVLLGHGDGTFINMTTYFTGIGSSPLWVALGDVNNDNRLDIVSANIGTSILGIFVGNGDGTFGIMLSDRVDIIDDAPTAVGVEDVNNDNYTDILITTYNDRLYIFLGNGNITFDFLIFYYIGFQFAPNSIAFADFNSDTHLDIVIANSGAGNIDVFLGYGNGSFKDPTPYPTGTDSQPYYAIVADFNNDNISDITVNNFGIDQTLIFFGDGNGNFTLARNYSLPLGSYPYSITAADLDNNKQLEIVVAFRGTGDIAVLTEYQAAVFVNSSLYSTGSTSQPFSIAISDFNNDNRSDIVVANSGTDNLGILLGSSNDTFDTEMMYLLATDGDPLYVITCDIDKDNHIDIVSVNSNSDSISVIMGYGNGTFTKQISYSTGSGSQPYAGASNDFNYDTRLDLVIANKGTDNIGIFLTHNYATFKSPVSFSNDDSIQPYGIILSDFNNDTYLDIAATFFITNKVGILLGYGNGSFTSMMIYSTGVGSGPTGIDAADFNNDGRSDIVVGNYVTNNVGVLLGYGNGSFDTIIPYPAGDGSGPRAVAVGDVNNDNRSDIVIANSDSHSVGVLLGYGNGSFSVVKIYDTGDSSSPFAIAVIDLDIDGQLDIIVPNYRADNIGIFFGYGNGSFENQLVYSTGITSWPTDVTFGDFNSDNLLDIAFTFSIKNNVGILLGNGNRNFSDIMTYPTGIDSKPYSVRVGDFNNDNYLDIAVNNREINNIVVLFGLGDGTFLLGTAYSTGIRSRPYELAVGDINKDGRLDIVVTDYDGNNIQVFFGSGSEHFAGMIPYNTGYGSQPHSVAVGDLNNDGWSDIVVANYGTDNVGILLGRKHGIFDPIITYLTGSGSAPYSVVVVDFNNDTHLDIAVTNSGTDTITILFGYGNGTFVINMTYSSGPLARPYTIAIGDLNNDNILDIAVANSGTSNIFLLYGYGNGTFGNGTSYFLGYGYHPYSIALKDLNQDNWMDIAIACHDTDHIETLINICSHRLIVKKELDYLRS